MKTYIWTVKNKKTTKFGWKFDVHVFKIVANKPTLIGTKEDINSGAMMGEDSEALSVLFEKGLIPEKYEKKYGRYFYRVPLEKLGINFIGI